MPGLMSIGGLTSGLKTDDIIAKYMDVARGPQKLIQSQQTAAQQKLAAWQDLNTRVLALQTSTSAISSATSFQTKVASSSLSDVASVTASSDATAGTYYVNVNKSAKSHQIASQKYAGLDSSVSEGTIKIAVDSKPIDVKITSSNNTLLGVKDAINKSGAGVMASVINKGTESNPDYRLMLTSNSTGSDHKMIVDAGTTGLNINCDDTGIPSGDGLLVQAAQDAEVQLGSLTFTRSTNSISDIIPGVTLNIANPDPTKTVKIDVTQDASASKSAVTGFVNQYNDIMTTIKNLTMYDSKTGDSGLLLGNFQIQSLQMDLQSMVTASVPEIPMVPGQKTYNALSAIGITTGNDGLLSINDADLSDALNNHAEEVGKLFGTTLDSDSPYISLVSSTSDTKPSGPKGYSVQITQAATRTTIQACKPMNGDTLGADETLTLNDKEVTLKAGMNLSAVIDEINKHSVETNVSAFQATTDKGTFLALRILQYGSGRDFTAKSNASVLTSGFTTSGLGNVAFSQTSSAGENGEGSYTVGLDVAGTINGENATGIGQVLSAKPDSTTSSVKGLQILATGSTPMNTSATFVKGVGSRIREMLSSMTGTNGFFTNTENSLTTDIDDYTKEIADMEERIQAQQDQMYSEFNNMESQLATLQQQGSTLSSQLTGLSGGK